MMTPQRKIYLALLAVAMVALIVDRALLGGGASEPGSADAADRADADASPEQAASDSPSIDRLERAMQRLDASAESLDDHDGLADQLAALASRWPLDATAAADPFTMPPGWQRERPQQREEPAATPEEDDAVSRFEQEHKLQAVMQLSEGEGLAIINNQPVRVGQKIGGFVLKQVAADRAVFEQEGQKAQLPLQRDLPNLNSSADESDDSTDP